ncbi:hypothetical protein PanWU01x14_060480 [Parasponia andersonii]|uniref:Retrovirus-related Pol polyprotein from transposon TNT 1-94 n=1 Tax=Parasponia andersonii TaxID=3476 RepID=A0A2P5DIS6_PARAD|nr:hypothetical protein PanWU01x14_060480 [Parasponia andersonii]
MSINDYILKMKSISENLSTAGQYILDKELILYILGGLSQDYDFVVVNLTSHCANLTLQEVQFMLQSHELCLVQLQSATTIDLSNPLANAATFKRNLTLNLVFHLSSLIIVEVVVLVTLVVTEVVVIIIVLLVSSVVAKVILPSVAIITLTSPSKVSTRQQSQSSSSSPQAVSNNKAFVTSPAMVNDSVWHLDSGACNHITADLNVISQKVDYKGMELL